MRRVWRDLAEVCDGADNDCDGSVDEGVLNACGLCGDVPEDVRVTGSITTVMASSIRIVQRTVGMERACGNDIGACAPEEQTLRWRRMERVRRSCRPSTRL